MQSTPIRRGAAIAPAVIATLLAITAQAQERVFAPLPPTFDVKTAPEPSRVIDMELERPTSASSAAMSLPPKTGSATGPSFRDPALRDSAASANDAGVVPPAGISRGIDHTKMYYDAPGDGSLWARGAHYKASFDDAGATYYPLFGADQPRHYPLTLSPRTVTLGGEPIAFERAATAVRDGDRIELDRGGFVERYEFATDTVEQVLVFRSLSQSGDLVVEIPVTSGLEEVSDLEPLPSGLMQAESMNAVELRSAHGRVAYGRAVAIDASGRRVAASTVFANGTITIRVDSSFLAIADMPLVIDPLVASFPIDATTYSDSFPDIAYDATTQRWLAVYQEPATAGDWDMYYSMCNSAGVPMWGNYINVNNASWHDASSANLASATQFLVAATVNGSGTTAVRGRTVEADIASMGNEFFISGTEQGDKLEPAVGGDPYPFGGAFYCVAYERIFNSFDDHDILVRMVGSDSSLSAINYLSNSGNTVDRIPSISRSNGGSNWTIVWNRLPGGTAEIWGGRVRFDGATVNAPFQITSGADDQYPSVSSPLIGSQRTMVVYHRDYGTDHDIVGTVLDGPTAIRTFNLSLMESTWFLQDQREPCVDSDGQHFVVAYSEQYDTSTTDYDVYYSDLFLSETTLTLAETHVNLAYGTQREGIPQIASTNGAGGQSRRYMVAWQRATSASNFDVMGALVDGLEGGAVTPFCFGDGSGGACPCENYGGPGRGCGNSANASGALLAFSGIPSTWNDTAVLTVSGVPGNTLCMFLQTTGFGNPAVFNDGLSCYGTNLIRLNGRNAVGGIASYPQGGTPALHNRGGVSLDGGTRAYQVWYRNGANYCTSGTLNLSNGLLVNWAR